MAGFVDAEGCIRINDRLSQLEVIVVNTHKCVLLYLQQHCGIHCTHSTHQPKNPRHAPMTTLRFLKDNAAHLLRQIQPLLHVKVQQATIGLRFNDPGLTGREQARMMEEMHSLNMLGEKPANELVPI